MQQSHLTTWQAYAPWPKRSQIEQDLRLDVDEAATVVRKAYFKHLRPL